MVAETLVTRGLDTIDQALAFIHPEQYRAASYQELPGIDAAVARLIRAHEKRERVCVWGDFDVDGQTATAILVEALRFMRFDVIYHIPNRERESHGVNIENLQALIGAGTQLFLTCDTGIGAREPVSFAQSRDADFIITDHHDLPGELPGAVAIVNPKLLSEDHPLRELPGVGVAYQLALGLTEAMSSDYEPESGLDLVALGIVSDLALQVRDVRHLLQLGLRRLRTTTRPGLEALMAEAGIDKEYVGEEQIAFLLGPRMNALGRLSDANPAVEFLLGENIEQAQKFARTLESLNSERKQLSDSVYASAQQHLKKQPSFSGKYALVLDNPHWPAGIVGLVAGRLAEEYRKPVILLRTEGGEARGSARSVAGIDISQAIASQAKLLRGYGGHPMAAGLVLEEELLPEFRHGLESYLESNAPGPVTEGEVAIDAYLNLDSIDLDLVDDLERLAPFGPGNPALVYGAKGLQVAGCRLIGKDQEHMLVRIKSERGSERDVLWWNSRESELPEGAIDLAYNLRSSSYRGSRHVQMEWVSARRHLPVPSIKAEHVSLIVEDHRFESNPEQYLKSRTGPGWIVWAEGRTMPDVHVHNRYELPPGDVLVLWTTPPDQAIVRKALAKVMPERLLLMCIDPDVETPGEFLHMLAGMAKYVLKREEGHFDLRSGAAALANSQRALEAGLDNLAAQRLIEIVSRSGEEFLIRKSSMQTELSLIPDSRLDAILRETAAFRAYLKKADTQWFSELID